MRNRWLLALALVAPACLFPALDGLSGGDASSVLDAAGDASINDVTATTDVPVDAVPEAGPSDACTDAAPDANFCALVCPPPTFCDDFDTTTKCALWSDGLLTGNGGSGTIVDGGVSPPDFAQFTTKFIDSGTAFGECRTQIAKANVITVDLDAKVNLPAAHYGLVSIETNAVAPYQSTRLFVDVTGSTWDLLEELDLTDGGSAGTTTPISSAIPSSWFHLTFTLDLNAHTATLVVDGSTIANSVPVSPAFVPSMFTLRAGIYFVSAGVGFQKVQLDNVVVHTQ